jgi:hypothetical protein
MQIGLEKLQLPILPNSISLMADAADAIANGFKAAFGGDEWTG